MPTNKTLAAAAMTAAIAGGTLFGATLGTPFASGAQDNTEATTTTEATDATEAPDGDHAEGRGHRGGFDLSVAAETLGLSEDDLKAQLEEGKTLAEIAEAQGVDKQALIDALVASAEARIDEMKAELPERIAEMVESGLPAGGPGEGRGGPGGHGGRGPGLDAAAEALGVTADDLRTAVEEGKTLAQVAEEQGVDVQTVIDAMVADLEAHLAEEVASGEHTQEEADQKLADATERITDMVNNGRPERPQGN
jgi:uncharacterized protein YidB (DUF937 family)